MTLETFLLGRYIKSRKNIHERFSVEAHIFAAVNIRKEREKCGVEGSLYLFSQANNKSTIASNMYKLTIVLLGLTVISRSLGKSIYEDIEMDNANVPQQTTNFQEEIPPAVVLARRLAILSRLQDQTDAEMKRSRWKQCAFNAVSCFG
ncbi:unnamed protein product [Allacma fusca]|uniref:Uncharacterized protein n=1 Tax=Allacma fusca TaxID=39272 RepID=A0A8J2JE88_9HEXA|nr:unnamed protein product [Allacma fusca]